MLRTKDGLIHYHSVQHSRSPWCVADVLWETVDTSVFIGYEAPLTCFFCVYKDALQGPRFARKG